MTMNDTLSTALSRVLNAEKIGKKECTITPVSKVILKVLESMKDHRYIGEIEQGEDNKSVRVNLIGSLNKCGAIKPRFSTSFSNFEKWEKRYLPAKGFGIVIVSTPKGIMIHEEAKKQHLGGRLLAYCY